MSVTNFSEKRFAKEVLHDSYAAIDLGMSGLGGGILDLNEGLSFEGRLVFMQPVDP